MQIQVRTSNQVSGGERLEAYVQSTMEATLERFARQLTRVEVHISDDNGEKSRGDDKRCTIEVRPKGMNPLAVTHTAGTVDEAIDGAAGKIAKLLSHTIDRLHDGKPRVSSSGEPT
jgi:ribosomal subunit interface protein